MKGTVTILLTVTVLACVLVFAGMITAAFTADLSSTINAMTF